MARDEGFAEYITEDVLGHIDGISRKVLFSGYGIYLDGVIVGIIIDGTFYTKTNKELMEKYKKEGSEPFQYDRPDGKIVTMPYVSVLLDVLEDREKISDRIYESFNLSQVK
ncbi:MAG: TfoX/Sxy family protein [Minisyncoccia bacterium]